MLEVDRYSELEGGGDNAMTKTAGVGTVSDPVRWWN